MKLYKFIPTSEIARIISIGSFRFYELTKYINIEDESGRTDKNECGQVFNKSEYEDCFEKLPTGSFGGIEFKCASIKPNEEYISQYFVFCMSTENSEEIMGDSKYVVELHKDVFETLEMLVNPDDGKNVNQNIFWHNSVNYYDIDHQPPRFHNRFEEIFWKHSLFSYQKEYRAAILIADQIFKEIDAEPLAINCIVTDQNGMKHKPKIKISAGIDTEGWRFIEIDSSEFLAALTTPFEILNLQSSS